MREKLSALLVPSHWEGGYCWLAKVDKLSFVCGGGVRVPDNQAHILGKRVPQHAFKTTLVSIPSAIRLVETSRIGAADPRFALIPAASHTSDKRPVFATLPRARQGWKRRRIYTRNVYIRVPYRENTIQYASAGGATDWRQARVPPQRMRLKTNKTRDFQVSAGCRHFGCTKILTVDPRHIALK